MSTTHPRVAIIHATTATISPVVAGFSDVFPEADLWHLVDDRLVKDAEAAGGLTSGLSARMGRIIDYAVENGADAVQLACSMYGPVAGEVAQPVPVIASDQALFDEVARRHPAHVLVLASLAPAAADSEERLRAVLSAAGSLATVDGIAVEGAAEATRAGDMALLADLMAKAIGEAPDDIEVVALAQYSMAPAAAALRRAVDVPVLSGPHLAAESLSKALREATGARGEPN